MRRGAILFLAFIAASGFAGIGNAEPLVAVNITGVYGAVNVHLGTGAVDEDGAPADPLIGSGVLDVTGGSLLFDSGTLSGTPPQILGFSILFEGEAPIQLSQTIDIGLGAAFDTLTVNTAELSSIGTYLATHVPLPQYPLQYTFAGTANVDSSIILDPGGINTQLPFELDTLDGFVRFTGFQPGDLLQLGVMVPLATFETVGPNPQIVTITGHLVISGTVVHVPEPDSTLLLIVGAAIACVGVRGTRPRARPAASPLS